MADVTREGDTASDQAERAGHSLAELLEREPNWHRLFIEFWVRAVHDPHLQHELAEQRRPMRALIADMLEEQAAKLELELPAASDELAVIVLALSNGIAIEHLADPDTVRPDLFATALRLLLRTAMSSARVLPSPTLASYETLRSRIELPADRASHRDLCRARGRRPFGRCRPADGRRHVFWRYRHGARRRGHRAHAPGQRHRL